MNTLFDPDVTLEDAQELIKNGADVNEKDLHGRTPLFFVKDLAVAKLLIKNGANVNAENNAGRTPLHLVNKINIARLLVKHSAVINKKDHEGWTPLDMCNSQQEEIINFLIKKGALDINKPIPLNVLTDYENTKLCIEKGIDINATYEEGSTILFDIQNISVMELVLKSGINVNHQNNAGYTALFMTYGLEAINLLIKYGADINIRNNNGETILKDFHMDTDEITLFIQYGAVPYSHKCYDEYRGFYDNEKQKMFDLYKTLTNTDNDFFNMCLAYQNSLKKMEKIEIKDMEII